jgi:hypothetical protein
MWIDVGSLTGDEAKTMAKWFDLTIDRAVAMRQRQDHSGAQTLLDRLNGIIRTMREHGKTHGYSVDLIFSDVAARFEAEAL